MKHDYWQARWDEGRIGFHLAEVNHRLVEHFDALGLEPGGRVFVPLCGKSVDMAWLLAKGQRVVGIDVVEKAVADFHSELALPAKRFDDGWFKIYRTAQSVLFVGDLFDLTPEVAGPVDVVWDRASLVALPAETRRRYAPHLMRFLAPGARMLLVAFEYDQNRTDGPPFSVPEAEVRDLFEPYATVEGRGRFDVTAATKNLTEKGVTKVEETVYLLVRNDRSIEGRP